MKVFTIRMYHLIAASGFLSVTFLMVCTFITIQQKHFSFSKQELAVLNKESYFPRKLKRTYGKYEIPNLPYYLLYRSRYSAESNRGPVGGKDFKIVKLDNTAYSETAHERNGKSASKPANLVSLRLPKGKRRTRNSRVIQGRRQEKSFVSAKEGVKDSFTSEGNVTELLLYSVNKQQLNTLKDNTDSYKEVLREQLLNGEEKWFKSVNKLLIPFGIRVSSNTFSAKDVKVNQYKVPPTLKVSLVSLEKKIPKFQVPFDISGRRSRTSVGVQNFKGIPVVEDDIFWSEEVDSLVSKGVTDNEVWDFIYRMRHLQVVQIEPPTWNRCGRPKNQYVTFQDGSHVCARYRAPHDYLIQGELLSFYLSRLLGIHHVPAVTLSVPNIGEQWKKNKISNFLSRSGWVLNSTVALIQWIDHLERERMPKVLHHALEKQQTISRKTLELRNLSIEQLVELAQWSDLIIFDYVTGNYDRVASMQDAADREKKPSILEETIHNLVKSRKTNAIWLIDNESGLLDSYSLLYGDTTAENRESRFISFHEDVLKTICIFRKSTVSHLLWLYHQKYPHKVLVEFTEQYEPLFKRLPSIYANKQFVKRFHERLRNVYSHIETCKLQFGVLML